MTLALIATDRFTSVVRRRRVALASLLVGGLAAAAVTLASPSEAEAAVRGGPNGIEFEGARDRRGVYVGPGVFFGFSGMKGTFVPDVGLNLAFGGGVSKRVLLGINLHGAKYLGRAEGASSWMFGGDFEFTGYAWQGLYLRTGLGGVGLPAGDPNNTLVAGIGGNVGVGYEFWLNATAAASVGITYDLRFLAGEEELVPAPLRHTGMVGMRFTFF
ncbi:hypothetical protein [Enhygromyxa salina]|uniref:Outer membrane protein beta-barrel domain-containing protein n=1 Tax=Enhygromyxa salina TaxID=215803 RepID=A0A2S9YLW5_9BACT|nr:hypothetical protein [Enhygromyxa salina]PRQ06095.1 hypothetical protein ENSA7_41290 [Enhygromyxa salina]